MKLFHIRKIRTKFIVPILLLQFAALGALGSLGYHFSSNLLRTRSEQEFTTSINAAYSDIEADLKTRLQRIKQLAENPIFTKFSSARYYKSDADAEIFNFQKGNGLILGEPKVGSLVNFPVGLLANEGNREVLNMGVFPSVEYVTADGQVKLHVYLGGSNEADYESGDKASLDRTDEDWFKAAMEGKTYVGRPRPMKLFMRDYQPISFENLEVPVEKELIPISMPHMIGGQIKGVFLVTTTPDIITDAMRGVSEGLLLMILDQAGQMMVESGSREIVPEPAGEFLRQSLKTPTDEIAQEKGRLVMHKGIPSAGWSVLVMGDSKLIYGSVWRLRNDIVLIMLISLAIMGTIIVFIMRELLKPVLKLTEASDRIAEGELGLVIEKQSEDEIGRLTESFNHMSTATKQMNDRLSKMNFIRRQLLGIISHELRTPLNTVVGFYDLMQMEMEEGKGQTAELSDHFEKLGVGIERCKALVERLTRASSAMARQINSGDEPAEQADLNEVLRIASEKTMKYLLERGITIRCPENVPQKIACPAAALCLILEEALSNAIKYSRAGDIVTVDAAFEGGFARISVKDLGPGISKEYIEDVVEPFFEIQDVNLHTTGRFTEGAGGLGLGLTIIMSIVKQYHGNLCFETPPEGGTVVIMSIPSPRPSTSVAGLPSPTRGEGD